MAQAAVLDDQYGLEPAKPPAAPGVSDDQYGLEPASKPAAKPVPVRAPGEAKQLTPEEVNKFQPPTKFEQERQHTPLPVVVPNLGVVNAEPVIRGAKAFGSDILEMGKSLAEHVPGVRTIQDVASGNLQDAAIDVLPGAREGIDAVNNLQQTQRSDIQRKEAGRSPVYRAIAGGAQATGLADPTGIEQAAETGDTAGIIGHTAAQAAPVALAEAARTPVGRRVIGAIGDLATTAGEKVAEMRQPGRMANFDNVVRDLAGKTPADLDFTKTLDKVRPDVAEIARKSGFAEKGNARVGEFQQMLERRAGEIWDEEHKPQVERHKDMPIDHEAIAQRATAAISQADRANNPAAARAADRWIASALNPDVIGTVGGADEMIRRINAEVPNLPEPFKVIGKTVRNAAVKALRGELEGALEATGEEGVKGPNTRWGALREVSNAIEGRLNNAVNKPLSWWDAMRSARTPMVEGAIVGGGLGGGIGHFAGAPAEAAAIGGGIGAATGAAGSLIHDVLAEPGGRIARAMKGLRKTNLQPETVQTPPWVGNRPAALIPEWAGGATPMGNGPDTSGPVPEAERHPPMIWSAEDINRVARETPKPPPNLPGEPTAIGTVQPVAMGPGQPGPLPTGPRRPPTFQRFPALPESVSGGETVPSKTVKPWQPLLGTPPEKVTGNVPRETSSFAPSNEAPKPEEPAAKEPEKPTGKPPAGTAERRGSARDITGPDFYRTARMNDLRRAAADPAASEEERALAQRQLDDMKANIFEKHEGPDINTVKAMNKPTMTREAAEAANEERKAGRQARFSEEGILPGMGEHVAKQAEGAARVKGEELTNEINRPRDVSEAAGRMETLSPLFRGTAASPQNEMFRPGGEPVKPMEPAKVETPKEEEPKEVHIKGITAKEPKPAKAKVEKPAPIEKRFGRDEIIEAEGLLNQESGMMLAGDRPGVYFDENPEHEFTPQRQQSAAKGITSGGKWRGVKSTRELHPFMSQHPEWGPEYVQKALRNKDSAAYQKVMDAAIQFIRDSKRSPEEISAAAEAKWKDFKPMKQTFVNLKKPATE